MWITLSKKTEFLELEERRVWPWRVPENFLSISNVNSSLGSLSTKYMRCSTTEPRVSLKLEVKVCRIRWHMWVSLIVRGWGMWQPVLAVRDFYVDTLNDGSGVEVPISMSTTLSDCAPVLLLARKPPDSEQWRRFKPSAASPNLCLHPLVVVTDAPSSIIPILSRRTSSSIMPMPPPPAPPVFPSHTQSR